MGLLAGWATAVWLVRPVGLPLMLGLALALVAAGLLTRHRSWRGLPWALVLFSTALLGLDYNRQIRKVEENWSDVRDDLRLEAEEKLAQLIDQAVSTAQAMAEQGISVLEESEPTDRFSALARGWQSAAFDGSVLLTDRSGRPVAWAGRFRLPPRELDDGEFSARMTPFYTVLEVWERGPRGGAGVQVVLASDPALPEDLRTVASEFRNRTGMGIEFFYPRSAPASANVYDSCLPSCDSVEEVPDTLFSVRPVPQSQGRLKLALISRGRTFVTLGLLLAIVLALMAGSSFLKTTAAVSGALLLILTPAPQAIGLEKFFSPASYFWRGLGPFSASTGAVTLTAALAVLGAVLLRRVRHPVTPVTLIAGALMIVAAPFALRLVARGITPPMSGVGLDLWITWEVAITLSSAAFMLLAAALLRDLSPRYLKPWMPVLAMLVALSVTVLGLFNWAPYQAWPEWYTFLWTPALLLAVVPAPPLRSAAAVAVVAGSASALLTWGAATEGKFELAQRDASRLGIQDDPLAVGFLEGLGRDLYREPLPRTAGALWREWERTPLAEDGYPAILGAWNPEGNLIARLELADLDVSPASLRAFAVNIRDSGRPRVEEIVRSPGRHYVLTVPYRDGSAVTVMVGPRSRLVPRSRLAGYLGPDRPPAPYDMALSDVGTGRLGERIVWRREGWTVHGEQRVVLPEGPKELHVQVPLLGLPQLVVRGSLIVMLDVSVVLVLWLVCEWLAGGGWHRLGLPRRLNWSSYRSRLALALALFFVVPTVGFTAWSLERLKTDARRRSDLVTRELVRSSVGLLGARPTAGQLSEVARRIESELFWYRSGQLAASSSVLLQQLGLIDRFLPPGVHRTLIVADEPEHFSEQTVGAANVRVAYRQAGASGVESVLAVPASVGDPRFGRGPEDIVYGLLFTTILGVSAALGLATLAARSLAQPVQALSSAARSVGRGERVGEMGGGFPPEFVPVVSAFRRMEQDVVDHRSALESALSFTSAVLDSVAAGVVAVDRELLVTAANPRARELFGRDLDEGDSLGGTLPEEWTELVAWLTEFQAGPARFAQREFTVGNRRIHAQVSALEGGTRGSVLAVDDATDLARAERVLAWGEMARQVAHEIKNPLTPLRLGVQHLARVRNQRPGEFDEVFRNTTDRILQEIERLDSIARAFSRFGAPGDETQPLEAVDLLGVARETGDLYGMSSENEVRVTGTDQVRGMCRADEFKEVLVNLIENSRNAGAEQVEIDVRPGSSGDAALVCVTDDGRGIEGENLDHIFEPQFSTTTSGTGLGLAICKRLVESWDAVIKVKSGASKGTTVEIEIPVPPGT